MVGNGEGQVPIAQAADDPHDGCRAPAPEDVSALEQAAEGAQRRARRPKGAIPEACAAEGRPGPYEVPAPGPEPAP